MVQVMGCSGFGVISIFACADTTVSLADLCNSLSEAVRIDSHRLHRIDGLWGNASGPTKLLQPRAL